MCTVTYHPYEKGFILTSNRDEAPHRSPTSISTLTGPDGQTLYLPKDTGGGSWIVASSSGRCACLLNGGFELHRSKGPYKRSRGLVVLDSFAYSSIADFWDHYDWEGIEPFTLIHLDEGKVFEGRWDGHRYWLTKKDATQPHLWASATLYDADQRAERAGWFRDQLCYFEVQTPQTLREFHLTGGNGDRKNDLVMQRPEGVQTVSISQLTLNDDGLAMRYDHLLDGQTHHVKIIG